jgi:uncharacterized OB-fold protein
MTEPAKGAERAWRDALETGEWLIQHSPSADAHVFYPREIVPGTGERDLEWVAPSGLGTLYSFTVVNRRAEQGGPYNVAVVELDEGPRMMSTVAGVDADALKIGMRLKGRVDGEGPQARVVFDPAEGA